MDGAPIGPSDPGTFRAGGPDDTGNSGRDDAGKSSTFMLFRSTLADGAGLLGADLRLAAAESAAAGRKVASVAAFSAAALLLAGVALNVAAAAAVAGFVAAGYPVWGAALLVLAIVGVVLVIALTAAISGLRSIDVVPHKALARMRADAAAVMEALGHARG